MVTVGPWTLGEKLGSGGNAVVWRATRDSPDAEVALKVINATKADKEPYQRFVAEIQFLQISRRQRRSTSAHRRLPTGRALQR